MDDFTGVFSTVNKSFELTQHQVKHFLIDSPEARWEMKFNGTDRVLSEELKF